MANIDIINNNVMPQPIGGNVGGAIIGGGIAKLIQPENFPVQNPELNNSVLEAGNVSSFNDPLSQYNDDLQKQYEQLKKEVDQLIMSDYSQIGAFFRPWSAEKYRHNLESKKEQLSALWNQMQQTKAAKVENDMNIFLQKNKYSLEQEALKKVGVENPFFMLRNGTLGGPNYSAALPRVAYINKPQYQSTDSFTPIKKFLKFLHDTNEKNKDRLLELIIAGMGRKK